MKSQPFEKRPAAKLAILALAVAALGLAALPAPAQEQPDPKKYRTVIKATMHIEVREAVAVLELLDVEFAIKEDQNLIVLRGDNYAVETAIKVIDALDEPRPSIDLRVFVVAASKEESSDVPGELESAVKQLKGVLGYTGFRLLDTITLQVMEGRKARADGGIRFGDDDERTSYRFSFQKVTVVPEDEVRVRFNDLRFEVDGPVAGTLRASLMTDVEIRKGQKAVIGSSTPRGDGDTLVLILEASVPDGPSWASE